MFAINGLNREVLLVIIHKIDRIMYIKDDLYFHDAAMDSLNN